MITIEEIKNLILPILKKYGVSRAGIFGSLVRGEASDDSDIDLLVQLPEEMGLLDFVGLKLDLEDILKKKVDILTYDSIYHLLREPILAEEVPIL